MRPNAAAADNDDFCGAEFGQAGVAEEDAVTGELFEDEFCGAEVSWLLSGKWRFCVPEVVGSYLRRNPPSTLSPQEQRTVRLPY